MVTGGKRDKRGDGLDWGEGGRRGGKGGELFPNFDNSHSN